MTLVEYFHKAILLQLIQKCYQKWTWILYLLVKSIDLKIYKPTLSKWEWYFVLIVTPVALHIILIAVNKL